VNWEWEGTVHENCVVFYKVSDEYGGLSNMSNEFPLQVNGLRVGSSEALYQAFRFPQRPDWQQAILDAPHAIQAKMKAKKEGRRKEHSRPDWEQVQEAVMRWCLRVKLAQHSQRFGGLLRWSAPRPIVERSRSDRFWGAVLERDGVLRGQNRLGQLLMELREELLACRAAGQESRLLRVEPPPVLDFLLLGQVIGVIEVAADRPISTAPREHLIRRLCGPRRGAGGVLPNAEPALLLTFFGQLGRVS
jgi:type I restriction enzyme S subunit